MTIRRAKALLLGVKMMWFRLILILLAASAAAGQQNQPSLQITSPMNNSIVNPGGTLNLTIASSPSGTAFSQIVIMGPGFIGLNVIAPTSLPTQFSMPIPPDADCRMYTVTVDGIPASGADSVSAQLQIDVEHSDAAVALSASLSSLTLQSQGEQSSISFIATFANSIAADVTESALISYASSNTGVVAVDASGTVTSVAPGNALITATYGQGATSFPLSIPVVVLPPLLTASPASLSFAPQSVGTNSAAQQVTLTNTSTGSIKTIVLNTTGDFSETDSCLGSLPLAVGNSCAANVTFSPTDVGSRTGAVSVTNSSSVVPSAIPLTGTGTAAPPTPNITSLSPTSGPVGTSVTITGTNFGSTQGSSTVAFNGTTATPTSWSTTSIVAPVPTGATTGSVVVTVAGVASNSVSFTVTAPPPTITSLNPTSGAVGTSVTITGTNFGTAQGSSTVTFNGTTATPTSWSATSIVAPVPTGATTGNVVVTVGGAASNGVSFTVAVPPPSITSINPDSGRIGTPVTITGANFGATQGTSTVTFGYNLSGQPNYGTVTSWSATSIVAPVAASCPSSGTCTISVWVTVGGVTSNTVSFTIVAR